MGSTAFYTYIVVSSILYIIALTLIVIFFIKHRPQSKKDKRKFMINIAIGLIIGILIVLLVPRIP